MRPIDALTDIDEKLIKSYISIYGGAECGPLSIVLQEWNKNKTTLFKAFGRKLTVSKEIIIPKDEASVQSELRDIYSPYIIYTSSDIQNLSMYRLNEFTGNSFISDVILFWVNQNYIIQDLHILSSLFKYKNLSKGYIDLPECSQDAYHFASFNGLSIKNGMKSIRTIQKLLKATRYPRMELFEEWRNKVSLVQTHSENKAKLVLSIHPIDFMTMSDNKCNWRSCMSWQTQGCYNAGTLEMMNSNVAVVAYLESKSPWQIYLNETNTYTIPNKSWRRLVFVQKDILSCGKPYPYYNYFLSISILNFIRELVQKNLKWTYQYINQEYKDMKHIDGNFYLRDWFNTNYDTKKKHHCIFVYTHGMYNDIIEAPSLKYLCCRNYVSKSKKICLSGPATCICCGKRLNESIEICSYDDLGSDKICYECQRHKCQNCRKILYNPIYVFDKAFCSKDCINNMIYFPKVKKVISKDAFQLSFRSKIIGFYDIKPWEQFKYDILNEILNQFTQIVEKQDIYIWVRTTQIKYSWIHFYKIPYELTRYNYIGIDFRSRTYNRHSSNQNDNYDLFLYDISNKNNINLEERLKMYQDWITLEDYLRCTQLEGGENEDSNTLTS